MKPLRVFFLLSFVLLPGVLLAQRPLGPILEVNTEKVGAQQLPHLAMNERGDFVITWLHHRAQDRNYSLYAKRFEADGRPATGDVLVVDRAAITSLNAEAVVMEDGSFVVVFPQDGGILKARSFGPDGTLEGESVLSENTPPSFAVAARGVRSVRGQGFVLAWSTFDSEVFVRSFSDSGEPVGPARRVGRGHSPSLAAGLEGGFMVTWLAFQPDPDEPRYAFPFLLAQRFSARGTPQGERIVVRAKPSAFIGTPKAARDGEGNLLVVWRERSDSLNEESIYARRYAADGSLLSGTLELTRRENRSEGPDLTMGRDGNFVLVWTEIDFEAQGRSDVFAQRFNTEGVPLRPAFQVSRAFGGSAPEVAGDANGNFAVVWHSRDESLSGVFARQFSRR